MSFPEQTPQKSLAPLNTEFNNNQPVQRVRTIPEISDADLAAALQRIRPVVAAQHFTQLVYANDPHPRGISFLRVTSREVAGNLRALTTIGTIHTFSHKDLFEPTSAQVIAQIPERLRPSIVAFKTELIGVSPCGKFHEAETTLYELNNNRPRKPVKSKWAA